MPAGFFIFWLCPLCDLAYTVSAAASDSSLPPAGLLDCLERDLLICCSAFGSVRLVLIFAPFQEEALCERHCPCRQHFEN